MKILAFSDLHRDVNAAQKLLSASREADVVVGAGDFATRQMGAADTLSVLKKLHCPFVLVNGNHETLDEVKRITDKWHNVYVLHGKGIEIQGITFFGLGCEIPLVNAALWNVGIGEDEAVNLLQACPANSILVTHAPPYGHCDGQADGSHGGSRAILSCVEKTQPQYVLCGHIHHSWGQTSQVQNTKILNLGPGVNWIEIDSPVRG